MLPENAKLKGLYKPQEKSEYLRYTHKLLHGSIEICMYVNNVTNAEYDKLAEKFLKETKIFAKKF